MRWVPGKSGMGTFTISSNVRVEATNVTHNGKATTTTPRMRIAWATRSATGRFSTMSAVVESFIFRCRRASILHFPLDEAELDHRERDHDEHEDHRLG